MNALELETLLALQFDKALSVRTIASRDQEEWHQIFLPFWHKDGDGYTVYLCQTARDHYVLTDGGYALCYLEEHGAKDFDTRLIPTIQKLCRWHSSSASPVGWIDGELQVICDRDSLLTSYFRLVLLIAKIEELEEGT